LAAQVSGVCQGHVAGAARPESCAVIRSIIYDVFHLPPVGRLSGDCVPCRAAGEVARDCGANATLVGYSYDSDHDSSFMLYIYQTSCVMLGPLSHGLEAVQCGFVSM